MTNPTTYYQENITKYQQLSNKYGKLNKQLSILRLLWFFLWMASIWFTTAYNIHTVVITAIAGLAVFVVLIIYHQKILRKKNTFQLFLSLNEKEIKSLRNDFSAFENGEEFIDERHFYSHDLDIFGSYSLFQFLNRCFSSLGKEKLANSLNKGLYKEEAILAQQKAIDELEKSPNWLQQFQVLGQQTQGEKAADIKALSHWGNKTGIFNALIFKIGAIVIPLLSWLMLYLLIQNDISFSVFSFYIIVPLGFSGIYASRINQNHQELSKQTSSLQKWQKLFRLFETSTFNTKAIQELQDTLKTEEETAGKAIKKLSSLAQAFDTRLNLLGWLILNYFFSWDILQSIRLEIWRKKYGKKIPQWFNTMAKMESLVSFATYKYNNPETIFPEIQTENFVYKATQAAHPLMPKEERVANPIDFNKRGAFAIVTGANMAGKSTYLRTLGTNLILAMAGAPVCAKDMLFTPIQLFTSIRTKDSLAKNQSYFYAELLRLQSIINELKNGSPLFIILDEILKGTNSKDKEMGSKALVKQLIKLEAVGVIATHDLQLGELINSFPKDINNQCFEVDIKQGQLYFDYTLRPGISQNLNATFLMKKMGISE